MIFETARAVPVLEKGSLPDPHRPLEESDTTITLTRPVEQRRQLR